MRINVVRPALACALLLAVTGCGSMFGEKGVFRDRSEDYKKAPVLPPITTPSH